MVTMRKNDFVELSIQVKILKGPVESQETVMMPVRKSAVACYFEVPGIEKCHINVGSAQYVANYTCADLEKLLFKVV